MKALTVLQCWADAIVDGYKDVENRTWKTNYRGVLLIHAGMSTREIATSQKIIQSLGHPIAVNPITKAIIGQVELVDCVRDAASQWAEPDQIHWLLANSQRFEQPIVCPGRLGLWTPDAEVLKKIVERTDW